MKNRLYEYRFVAILMQRAPRKVTAYTVAIDADKLMTLSRRLHVLAEQACNRELTPREESAIPRLGARAAEISRRYRLTIRGELDPRCGSGLTLHLPGATESDDALVYIPTRRS